MGHMGEQKEDHLQNQQTLEKTFTDEHRFKYICGKLAHFVWDCHHES